jgi:3-hydroxyacyl-[acyl-carrier-protein] dehydratase
MHTEIRSYDSAAVQRLLAHRHPFLLVDRIDVVEPGRRVRGVKQLTAGEWWSSPSSARPIPFPLVLEALAQTGAAILAGLVDVAAGAVGYFMAADHVRFRNAARAGDTLHLDVSLRHWKRGICKTHGIATIGDRVVVTADLTTFVRSAR